VLGHFGTNDDFISEDDATELEREMKDAGVQTSFHFYDAGHAFFNDTNRLGTYNQEAAQESWERTVKFLRDNLT
jgi:carboxymethylenebutenolidase